MPGMVVKVAVAEGQPVQRGDTLVVLEAMKTELPVSAPRDGTVERVHCQPQDTVEAGQALVTLQERAE